MSTVYADADWYAIFECQSHFVDGRCPPDESALYVFGREHRMSQDLLDSFRSHIYYQIGDCLDLDELAFVDRSRESFVLLTITFWNFVLLIAKVCCRMCDPGDVRARQLARSGRVQPGSDARKLAHGRCVTSG